MVTGASKIAPKSPFGCTAQEAEFAKLRDLVAKLNRSQTAGAKLSDLVARLDRSQTASAKLSDLVAKLDRSQTAGAKLRDATAFPSLGVAKVMQDLQKQNFALKQAMGSGLYEPYFKDNIFLPTLAHPPREIPYIDNEREIEDAEKKTSSKEERVKQGLQDDIAEFCNLASVKKVVLPFRIIGGFLFLCWIRVTSKK